MLLSSLSLILSILGLIINSSNLIMIGILIMPISWLIIVKKSNIFSIGSIFFFSYIILYASSCFILYSEQNGINFIFMTCSCFHLCSLSYLAINPKRKSTEEIYQYFSKVKKIKSLDTLIVFIPMMLSILLIITSFGFSTSTISRADIKEESGLFNLLGIYLFNFSLPSLYIFGTIAATKKKIHLYVFFLVLAIAISILMFLVLRVRTAMLAPIVTYIIGIWHATGFNTSIKKSLDKIQQSNTQIAKIIIIVILVASAGIFGRFYRGAMEVGGMDFNLEVASSFLEKSINGGDFGYGLVVNEVMKYSDHNDNRLNGQSYYRTLFAPFPRFILPEKPLDTQRIVAEWLFPQIKNMTIPPGIQGDAYINFGYFGFLLFIIYGIFFAWLDKIKGMTILIFTGCCFVSIFHFTRGAFTNPIIIMLVIYLGAKLHLNKILKKY